MQVDWTKSEKGTKYGTHYEVLEGSFRWSQTIICTISLPYHGKHPIGPGSLEHHHNYLWNYEQGCRDIV